MCNDQCSYALITEMTNYAKLLYFLHNICFHSLIVTSMHFSLSDFSDSDTITLRGDPDKLGPALTMVYSKANSVVVDHVDAPAWLHRFIIGRKGINIRQIMDDYPKVHIEFTDGEDKITVEGPPEQVNDAKLKLDAITKDFVSIGSVKC